MSHDSKAVASDEYIKSKITAHPDFPVKGVLFRDIFPVLQDPVALEMVFTKFMTHIVDKFVNTIDVVVGIDSRGFLFGPTLAMRLKCAFVPIRKVGKLPGECISADFEKEYGKDTFEMQKGSVTEGQRCLIIDDLLATGGTMSAACKLVKAQGGVVSECLCVIELDFLKGKDTVAKEGADVHALFHY